MSKLLDNIQKRDALEDGPDSEQDTVFSNFIRSYVPDAGRYDPSVAAQLQHTVDRLTSYAEVDSRLRQYGSDGWIADLETAVDAMRRGASLQDPESLLIWESFARENAHILRKADEQWPANRVLLQLAIEHADDSPVTRAAEKWLAEGGCDWVWLRNPQRPPALMPQPCLRVLTGHHASVEGALVLDDERVLSWSSDKMLCIWRTDRGANPLIPSGHDGPVMGALIMQDRRVLSWSDDATLRLWDEASGRPVATLTGHTGPVKGALIMPDGHILSWSEDKTLRLWDRLGIPLHILEGHSEAPDFVSLTPSGHVLSCAAGGGDNVIRVWDRTNGTLVCGLREHLATIQGVEVMPDGRVVSLSRSLRESWSQGTTLRLWDSSTGQLLSTAREDAKIFCDPGVLALSNGRVLSWTETTMCLRDGTTLQPLVHLHGHEAVGGALAMPGDRVLSWGGTYRRDTVSPQMQSDSRLKIWNASTGEPGPTLVGHEKAIRGATLTSGGQILSWSDDRTIRVWNGRTGNPIAVLEGHDGDVNGAAAIQNGHVLSWSSDGTLRIWDLMNCARSPNRARHRISDDVAGPTAQVLPSGRILSHSDDQTMRLWNRDNGNAIAAFREGGGSNYERILPDGRILSWATDHALQIWDPTTGKLLATLRGHRDKVGHPLVMAGGRILSFSADATLRLWNSKTGALVSTLAGHEGPVNGALILPNERILSWSDDHTLRLWDGASGHVLKVLTGHTDRVASAVLLPNGRILSWSLPHEIFSRCNDSALYLWECDTGALCAVLAGHGAPLGPDSDYHRVLVLEDGRILSWTGWELSDKEPSGFLYAGALRLWDSERAELLGVLDGTRKIDLFKSAIALSDERILLLFDHHLGLWDVAGDKLQLFKGHREAIDGAVPLTDGTLLSWDTGKNLCLWDEAGRLLERATVGEAVFNRPTWIAAMRRRDPLYSGFHGFTNAANRLAVAGIEPPLGLLAAWHSERRFTTRAILDDGTVLVTAQTGEVLTLKLFRGHHRSRWRDLFPRGTQQVRHEAPANAGSPFGAVRVS